MCEQVCEIGPHPNVSFKTLADPSHRFSGLTSLLAVCFGGFYLWKVLRFSQGIAKLWRMHEFFTQLLEVSEVQI